MPCIQRPCGLLPTICHQTTLLTLWDGGKEGMQPGNVFCVDCGAWQRGIREAAILEVQRVVKEESLGARYIEKKDVSQLEKGQAGNR